MLQLKTIAAKSSMLNCAVVFTILRADKAMNDLPVIGYHAMRKELWDRQGQTKEIYDKKLFPRPKKGILERNQHSFAVLLSQMDLRNVEIRKILVDVRITVKYDKIYR